jgi:hypothetical protein
MISGGSGSRAGCGGAFRVPVTRRRAPGPVHDQRFGPPDRAIRGWLSPNSDHVAVAVGGRSMISGSGPTNVLSAAGRSQTMITGRRAAVAGPQAATAGAGRRAPVHDQRFGPGDRAICGWSSPTDDQLAADFGGPLMITGSGRATVPSAAGRPQTMITRRGGFAARRPVGTSVPTTSQPRPGRRPPAPEPGPAPVWWCGRTEEPALPGVRLRSRRPCVGRRRAGARPLRRRRAPG